MEESFTPLFISINTKIHIRIFRLLTIITTVIIITFCVIYELPEENYSSFSNKFESKPILSSSKCNYGPNGPRIYCAVLTHFGNLQTKAQSVRKTWGRRCDKLIFGTGRKPNGTNKTIQEILPESVELDTSDAYGNLTAKSIAMLKYVYETTKPGDFDWLIKADDDTYVIMDNLKWFLNDHCPNETYTYGLNFNIGGNKYHSGGGGYTISSSIIHKLGSALKNNNSFCAMKSGYEDIEVAECLKKLNVTLGESRDSKGRERFHGTSFRDHYDGIAKWMESYAMYWPKYGPDCCSPTSITFHYVDANEMFRFDHLFYKIRRVKPNFNPNTSDYD